MQSLRSVITQATRGGRWVSSRRNFSSSSVPKETNGAVREGGDEPYAALKREMEEFGVKKTLVSTGYASIGALLYLAMVFVQKDIAVQELREAKKLALSLRDMKNEN